MDNIIAALGHSNRVYQISLTDLADWQLEQVSAAMQVPFPELTYLEFSSKSDSPPVIPDSFLGGSAQSLEHFHLNGISLPGLPKVLLSATHLVQLWLYNIPDSGYISPKAMVALLSALSSLDVLSLEFQSPRSRPYRETRSPPPPDRSILPVLSHIYFRGATEYLEDFVTIIDAPKLGCLEIEFFDQINFDTQRFGQFINRTFKLVKANVEFGNESVRVEFGGALEISIPCREPPDRRLSSIAQVCNSSLPSTVEDLYIERKDGYSKRVDWQNDAIENILWLQLLIPFAAVKNIYLHKEFGPGIAAALQELVDTRTTEVLPSLQSIFVELEPSGPSSFQENIGQFVAARQLSDHPITISDWPQLEPLPDAFPDSDDDFDDNDSDMELM
jgi:hypothetical protein